MPTASLGALAQRTIPPMVSIIQANQPLPPAHFTSMVVTVVVEETVGQPGLECWAVGTGPGGETVTAIGGESPPTVGELWRCISGEGGIMYLDDIIRVGP